MRHSPFTAVYDACVLYPAPLRDLLMWLGLSDLFRFRWSDEIHREWKRNLLIKHPDLNLEQLDSTTRLIVLRRQGLIQTAKNLSDYRAVL